MKTKQIKVKKDEASLSAETMHKNSVKWLSELNFARDEQLFFDDLVKSYTLQLIDSKHFSESKKIVDQINTMQKETDKLIDIIINHEKGLKIMVDGINDIEKEDAYKAKHKKLITTVSKFIEKYRVLKSQLFALIKSIIKQGKQKRLLQ